MPECIAGRDITKSRFTLLEDFIHYIFYTSLTDTYLLLSTSMKTFTETSSQEKLMAKKELKLFTQNLKMAKQQSEISGLNQLLVSDKSSHLSK